MNCDAQDPPAGPEDIGPSLVFHLREGDPEAARILETNYRGAMMRFCRGYVATEDDAEDAVQEVFCKVLATRQVPACFQAWIYKIARNHCLNLLRRRARNQHNQVLPSDVILLDIVTGNVTRLVRQELHSRLRQLLSALSASHREALRLRYVEGLSRTEIAEVLDLPESVVKSRIFEGLQKLRQHTSLR